MSLKIQLAEYLTRFPNEQEVVSKFLLLLEHPAAFLRTHQPGHITGSAFIVSKDHTQTLLVHHGKLNRWLQPGGHADGDTDVLGVAMREAREETGLTHLDPASPVIYDLDIHPIPARKDFPAHDHYDVRFLIVASTDEQVVVSEESHDVKWIPLEGLEGYNGEKSILRLKVKLGSV